ncbi:MAG: 2-oxo acid dehydrogenase subunit E2, partial [Planctomycetota bacterium]
PRLNRFVAGKRIYQRRGIWVSSSGKKQKSDDAPMVVMKIRIEPGASFEELVRSLTADVERHRSEVPTATDRELSLLLKLPGFLLSLLMRGQRCLDRFGLLPSAFIRSDPMYASAFIGNLGSLGPMEAPFHHLYEYGTISMFLAVGAIRKQVVPGPDDQPVVAERMPIRYAFDERVEDGLYCLKSLERFKELLETPAGA